MRTHKIQVSCDAAFTKYSAHNFSKKYNFMEVKRVMKLNSWKQFEKKPFRLKVAVG